MREVNIKDSVISNWIRGLETTIARLCFSELLFTVLRQTVQTQKSQVLAGLLTKGNI